MALSGGVLTLGLFLRPALQGGSLCCTLSLGTNTLIPSRTTLGFGQPCNPSRHTSPHADHLCRALQSGWKPVRSAETLMRLWGRVKGDGTSQRCTVPDCCPNVFLDFMFPPELYRLHCRWEEAEERAAPQIVSVLVVLWDQCGGSGFLATSAPYIPLGGGSGWVLSSSLPCPRCLPSKKTPSYGVVAGFFCPGV